jgi:hypothetical protein
MRKNDGKEKKEKKKRKKKKKSTGGEHPTKGINKTTKR